MKIFILLVLFFITSACSHQQCNNVPQRPLASENETANNPSAPPQAQAKPDEAKPMSLPKDTIQVYKATGELQCEPGKGVPLEQFQTQFSAKKIQVYDAHTQPDGLMHMAVCGSPSGTIHVLTISKKDLKKAERLGFKIFNRSK